MDSYRVKLHDGRIVGPLTKEQLGKLYLKGMIQGQEECQNVSTQQWNKIFLIKEVSDYINKLANGNVENRSEIRPSTDQTKSINNPINVNESQKEIKNQSKVISLNSDVKLNNKLNSINTDSTIINTSLKKLISAEKIENKYDISNPFVPVVPQPSETEIREKAKKEEEEKKVDLDAKTYLFDIKKLKNTEKNVSDATFLIDLEEENSSNISKTEKKESAKSENSIPEKELNNVEKIKKFLFTKNKSGMKPIILISFVVVFYFLIFDKDSGPPPIVLKPPSILFPISNDVDSKKDSFEFYQKGLIEYAKRSYISKVNAANLFRKSLEYQFQNNDAIGYLILSYAEIYSNATNKIESGKVIARLMRITQQKMLSDLNVIVGAAKFYSELEKPQAAIRVIENYLRVGKPSVKLLSTYLDVLIVSGELTKARNVFNKLTAIKDKSPDVYSSLALFLFNDDNYKEAKKIVEEGAKKYKHSVPLLFNLAKILVYEGDFKKLIQVLALIRGLGAENSRIYYAKYLEYLGILSAVNNDQISAAKYFKEGLRLNESEELRSKLASLEIGGEKSSKSLILESKTIDLIQKAKNSMKNRDWQRAFSFALEAVDISPNYIPANIVLAKIQMSKGFFDQAIKILSETVSHHPQSELANFALVDAYINSYKFDDARKLLSSLVATHMGQSYKFPSLYGKMYYKDEKYLQAIKNFQRSVQRNPLNDEDFFQLAKLYLLHRRYNRGKSYLLKAISLDPTNVIYRTKYATLLYELENTETAIGYLRDVLDSNPDDPLVLGEIAIYYYRSGQIKFFEEYRNKLESIENQDRNLYEFLVKKAQLDDDENKVIEYTKELVKIDPSDLESKIKLGNIYITKGKYQEALVVFDEIKNRLASFPKLNYYFSRIEFLKGNLVKAIELAKAEITANPNLEDGYVLLADIYKKQDKFTEAEENYKMAQLKNNKSIEALLGLAWIKYKRNHADAALDLYLKASGLAPRNAYIRKQLGHVYRALGQSALAVESFNVYLELSPDAEDKAQIQALINELK